MICGMKITAPTFLTLWAVSHVPFFSFGRTAATVSVAAGSDPEPGEGEPMRLRPPASARQLAAAAFEAAR